MRPPLVTVRTNHVALVNFGKDDRQVFPLTRCLGNSEHLRLALSMIELQNDWVRFSAVNATRSHFVAPQCPHGFEHLRVSQSLCYRYASCSLLGREISVVLTLVFALSFVHSSSLPDAGKMVSSFWCKSYRTPRPRSEGPGGCSPGPNTTVRITGMAVGYSVNR